MAIEALRSAIDKLDGAETQLSALRRASHEGAVTELLTWRIDRDEQGWVRARVEELREPPPEWFVFLAPLRTWSTACHAEGRGFESHQPLQKGLHLQAFLLRAVG